MSTFQRTTWSRMPRATPAAKARGRERSPATTAAASAGSMTCGPEEATERFSPSTATRSSDGQAASPPAIVHTSRESRWAGMPSSRARSPFSAMPRIGDAGVGAQQEPGQRAEDERHDDHQREVVAGDQQRVDVEA